MGNDFLDKMQQDLHNSLDCEKKKIHVPLCKRKDLYQHKIESNTENILNPANPQDTSAL